MNQSPANRRVFFPCKILGQEFCKGEKGMAGGG